MAQKFILNDWDGNSVICSSWRHAKALLRYVEKQTYCASVKRYRGPLRPGTHLIDGCVQEAPVKQYVRNPIEE